MKTAKILKKSVLTPGNNWISLLNSANLIKKNAVTPVNFHLYHYASNNPIIYTDPDGRDDWRKVNVKQYNPWHRETVVEKWQDYYDLMQYDVYAFSGLMNEYRVSENAGSLNQMADNWSTLSSEFGNAALVVQFFTGVSIVSPEAAIAILAIDKFLQGVKPKQFNRAADVMGAFTGTINSVKKKGMELVSIDCTVYSEETTVEMRYPNSNSYSSTKTKYKIGFVAHFVDPSKNEDDPDRTFIKSCVVEFEK